MKLPTVLYVLLVLLNLLSLGFIIGAFILERIDDFIIILTGRFTAYLFYITVLFNLYALFYIGIRKKYDD